mmetsp:Transcript_67128/g.123635  ORF Transcript_67128/g.123635 Transcript_67128/m.123635 type:complete len:203 (+) Transcript_67128:390-998(+)
MFANFLPCAQATAPGQIRDLTATTWCDVGSGELYTPLSPKVLMDHAGDPSSLPSGFMSSRSAPISFKTPMGKPSPSASLAAVNSSFISSEAVSGNASGSGIVVFPTFSRGGLACTQPASVTSSSAGTKSATGSSTTLILFSGAPSASSGSYQPRVASTHVAEIRAICARSRCLSLPGNQGIECTGASKLPVKKCLMARAATT